MIPVDDDPARATLRVAESVVALVRAEFALALAKAKASGVEVVLTLTITAASAFLTALAVVVLVFSPVLWAYRPSAAIGSLSIAVALAAVSSLVTWRRWHTRSKSRATDAAVTPGQVETRAL